MRAASRSQNRKEGTPGELGKEDGELIAEFGFDTRDKGIEVLL